MVRFLYRAALVNHDTIVTLMVFQVVVILAVAQCNITLFGKKQLLDSVFIDHISTVIRRGGGTAYLMDRFQLCAVGCISIGDGTSLNVTTLDKFKQLYDILLIPLFKFLVEFSLVSQVALCSLCCVGHLSGVGIISENPCSHARE